MKTIVCPVGASLFYNYTQKEVAAAFERVNKDGDYINLGDRLKKFNTQDAKRFENTGKEAYNDIYHAIERFWLKDIQQTAPNKWEIKKHNALNESASAEVYSLVNIIQYYSKQENNFTLHLICPDSLLSRLAVDMLQMHLESEAVQVYLKRTYSAQLKVCFDAKVDCIKDLNVYKGASIFRDATMKLLTRMTEIEKIYPKKDLVLNTTGGYKVLLPYLTVIGAHFKIKTCYIFENGRELLFPLETFSFLR